MAVHYGFSKRLFLPAKMREQLCDAFDRSQSMAVIDLHLLHHRLCRCDILVPRKKTDGSSMELILKDLTVVGYNRGQGKDMENKK